MYILNLKIGYHVVGGIMSPVADAYGKKNLAPAIHRLEMCRLACQQRVLLAPTSPPIIVDEWECLQEKYTRTFDVLESIQTRLRSGDLGIGECRIGGDHNGEPRDMAKISRVLLLCGGDVLKSMAIPGVWRNPDEILRRFGVVCVTREGSELPMDLGSGTEGEKGRGREAVKDVLDLPLALRDENGQVTPATDILPSSSSPSSSPSSLVQRDDLDLSQQLFVGLRDRIEVTEKVERSDGSSTMARAAVAEGGSVEGLLEEEVVEYIRIHGLYGSSSLVRS
mmetsp:Transcript_28442/g.52381  ORF Transcript_28442/g.52381 Transcript_28442/m.52381 type:complete len:280 (-) Transcript_28442:221-1060(-)